MELKKYLLILKTYLWFILIFTFIAGLTAFLASFYKAPVYEGSITFMINPIPKTAEKNPTFYEYDGYYAIQSSQLFANTVGGWLTSPDVVYAIYQKAGITIEAQNVKDLKEKIKTSIRAGQNLNNLVDANFQAQNRQELQKLSTATYEILNQKTQQFNQSTGNKINYKIEKLTDPVIIQNTPNLILNSIIGGFSGLILSIILAFFFNYLKNFQS